MALMGLLKGPHGVGHGKVFGIGLSKTGTTSMNAALEILGLRSVHYPPVPKILSLMAEFDAATDTPVACCFAALDRAFPGSKFILTVRGEEEWVVSAAAEFEGRESLVSWQKQVRLRTYGSISWCPDVYLKAFRKYSEMVKGYFRNRPGDLLIMSIADGDGWDRICPFLNRPQPGCVFPRLNSRAKGASADGYLSTGQRNNAGF